MKTEWARVSAEVKEAKAIQITFYSRLGAAIRRERCRLGISQEELARRSDLQRTYISDLERGTRNPSVGSIQRIAHALQVPVAKLFEHSSDGNKRS
jgi:transcriptional regulator with XRE-family HTH domain